jgi:hypothetical protein
MARTPKSQESQGHQRGEQNNTPNDRNYLPTPKTNGAMKVSFRKGKK